MRMRRGLLLVALCTALLLGGAALVARERMARCAAVPLLAGELLPNAGLAPGDSPRMPQGWASAANGVELRGPAIGSGEGFDLDGDGRALQLIGIANDVETPPAPVRPGQVYCFAGQALTDSGNGSATRLRVVFDWRDAAGQRVTEQATNWQPVVLWRKDAPPQGWSPIGAAFEAPIGAASLRVRLEPASDDRIYLDAMHIRPTTDDRRPTTDNQYIQPSAVGGQRSVVVEPWPEGRRAALSFSFDWETAMGGLIHSRSDDPHSGQNALDRAMRMRQGVTTTLDLFRPYGIRATYYANGYNFLLGNTERRQFMGDPTFTWATRTNGWPDDTWATTPWFAKDPYGTARSDPGWYFGDLIPLLRNEHQDPQSHTFSHFYGGRADAAAWRADLAAWNSVAAERGAPPARSLAFPWSGSDGMSYANWDALAAAGISSVTRTSWSQRQYDLFGRDKQGVTSAPFCRPVPGHEHILACPDFYLTVRSAPLALKQLGVAIAAGGMIDLWAHTEEVVSPDQIAAWGQVVGYAAQQRDSGKLWIAPLAEIADWQTAVAELRIENVDLRNQVDESVPTLTFTIHNGSQRDLSGVTLSLPWKVKKIGVDGAILNSQSPRGHPILNSMQLNIQAGQTVEVQAWPA
jgi:hypothetical protein